MFDAIAGWFVMGMFVAGVWIVVGALLPASAARPAIDGDGIRTRRRAGRPSV